MVECLQKLRTELLWLSFTLPYTDEERWIDLSEQVWRRLREENEEIKELFVLDKEGKGSLIFPLSLEEDFRKKDFSSYEFYRLLKYGNTTSFSSFYYPTSKSYRILLGVPIKKEREFLGILALTFNPVILYRLHYHPLRIGKGTQLFLVDSKGNILLSPIYSGEKLTIINFHGEILPLKNTTTQKLTGKLLFPKGNNFPPSIISIIPFTLFSQRFLTISATPEEEVLVFPLTTLRTSLVVTFIAVIFIILGSYSLWSRIKMGEKLYQMSISDGLTGLLNHSHFYATLSQEILRAKRYKRPVTLLMLDIDGFKNYNDTHGHPEGDKVLKKMGKILLTSIRKGVDTAYRYGGDEFTVILPETTGEEAKSVAERIRKNFAQENSPGLSLSIGIVQYKEGWDPEGWVKVVDEALYRAKRMGGNVIYLFSHKK